jgi:hypothetical protein
MGAVLAMRGMGIRSGLVLAALVALAGCSSDGTSRIVDTFRTIAAQAASVGNTEGRDARAVLTPQIVAAATEPYLLVDIPSRQASATRALYHQRGPLQDWRGADGISLVLRDDVLIATRGLGPDLFAADPVPPRVLRAAGPGSYARAFRHLDGENREVVSSYSCRLAPGGTAQVDLIARIRATRHVVETCTPATPGAAQVVNEYWIGTADNLIWKSKQWVGETVGYVTLSHLVR